MNQSSSIVSVLSCMCAIAAGLGHAGLDYAQTFPTKPIRMVTTQPGNAFDIATRLIAERLAVSLGQPVIVDNRGGAGAVIAGEIVARAQPDGHTLLSYGNTLWQIGFMLKDVPFNVQKDFAPITLAIVVPNLLLVHPSVAAGSVKELVALAKARPGQLNYGGGNPGSSQHLAAELFKSMAGVNIVNVPYKSTVQTLVALAADEVQVMFTNVAAASPYVKAGKIKMLAVTTTVPFPPLPGVPTVSASGLPGFESAAMLGIFAPARTPTAIVSRLNRDVVKILNTPEVTEKFLVLGAMVAAGLPEQLAATVRKEMETTGKLIKTLGIRAEL